MRALRHWSQRYDPNARFVFRRRLRYDVDVVYEAGDDVPDHLRERPGKLRNLWEAGVIELAECEADADADLPPAADSADSGGPETPSASPESATSPADVVPPPARDADAAGDEPTGVTVESKGSWHTVTLPDGSTRRVQGKAKLEELLASLSAGA